MAQQAHPITLEQVLFTRSIVIAVPGHEQGDLKHLTPPENKIDVSPISEEPGRYSVTMHTVMNKEGDTAAPYIIDMECIGVFFADDTLSEDEAIRGVTITAHSVLYGAIREAVAWLTGRQPYGALMLGLSVLQGKPTEKSDDPDHKEDQGQKS